MDDVGDDEEGEVTPRAYLGHFGTILTCLFSTHTNGSTRTVQMLSLKVISRVKGRVSCRQ